MGREHQSTIVPLMIPSYGEEEIRDALKVLKSKNVTMGEKVREFEYAWAKYVGTKYALMLNSGSSANLLAHTILSNPSLEGHISPGAEVITPAVTWATTVFPIINIGATPVFVDVDLETMDIDVSQLESAVSKKTRAITYVHLLGNPVDMDGIGSFAEEHDLMTVEDACNAHGATYGGKRCGSFGSMATFSFYFSHIISTVEGGMLNTDDEEYYEIAKAMRTFGWTRGLREEKSYTEKHPQIDNRFLFAFVGFNFRPMEIQGAFGLRQLKRLEGYLRIRRENARYWLDELREFERYFILPRTTPKGKHVWHHFPITVRPGAPFSRERIVAFLEKRGIQTRPIAAGNMAEQPALRGAKIRQVGHLPNARVVMRNSFQWGNHQGIQAKEREYVVKTIRDFVRSVG